MFVTPSFWNKQYSVRSLLLLPLSWINYVITSLRNRFTTPYTASCPIICIGNATMGGSGKTPVAMKIASLLVSSGKSVVFLSKGYGGTISSATLVDPEQHTAKQVGDEPLLLCRIAPVVIAKNRIEGVMQAESLNPDVIIMDDGLQNPTLTKNLSILVVDNDYLFGNERIFPSGPLREPIYSALSKVKAVIAIGDTPNQKLVPYTGTKKTIHASILPNFTLPSTQQRNVVAFAGIGRPDKFFDMLEKNGYNVKEKIYFPDHYYYTAADETTLHQKAEMHDAVLFTTEKDYIKLSSSMQQQTHAIAIQLKLDDDELKDLLN
ncbi:MAG: tetraacyldisaccharide 4'-kinase, partial [Rickettsiales bacterium]|nr:tetraacyldisaccharide 4'-kinase [Rickettsiales bacterium]